MMRNFLKATVNALVIFSILITSIPLQAMEESEEDREKRDPHASKAPSKKRQNKKEPIDFIKRNKEAVKARSAAPNPQESPPIPPAVEPETARPAAQNDREDKSNKPKIRNPSSSSRNKTKNSTVPTTTPSTKVKPTPNKGLRETKSTPSSQRTTMPTKIKSIEKKESEETRDTTRFQSKISSKAEKSVLKNSREDVKSIGPYYLRITTAKTKTSPATNLDLKKDNPSLHSKVKSKTTTSKAPSIQREQTEGSSVSTTTSSTKVKPVRMKNPQEAEKTISYQRTIPPGGTKSRQKISSGEKKVKIEEERKKKEEHDRINHERELKEEKERKQKKEQFRIAWEERVEALERSLQECTQKEEEERKRLEEERKLKEAQERIEHERKLKQVEERKQKEEQYRIAYEELKRISERVKQERMQREKEEQDRIIHEQKIKEDKSRRKAEEGELKRKFETERKKKEEEDHRRAEEEALKRKQEEERKKEQNRIEHERKLKEEEDRIERERKLKEEEERKLKEEQDRIERERKLKEEKERKLKEEQDRIERERKLRKEEERRLKEEKDRIEHERKQREEKARKLKKEQDRIERERRLREEERKLKEEQDRIEHERKQKEEEDRKLKRILTPFEGMGPPITLNNAFEESYDPEPITIKVLPTEVMQLILGCLGIPSTFIARQVCKFWRELSINWREKNIEASVQLLKEWKPGNESEQLLRAFTSSPYHLLTAVQALGSVMPLCLKHGKFDWGRCLKAPEETYSIPTIAEKFVSVLKNSSPLNQVLCRIFLNHIDVLDIHSTSFAAYIVNQIPKVQELLQKSAKALQFEPKQFSELTNDFKNHPRLQQYLMALKLLTMTGSHEANSQQSELRSPIRSSLRPEVNNPNGTDDKNEKVKEEQAPLTNHPFWGLYDLDHWVLDAQWDAVFVQRYYGENLDSSVLKTIWQYYLTVDSQSTHRTYGYLKCLFELCYKRGDERGFIDTLLTLRNPDLKVCLGYISGLIAGDITPSHLSFAMLIHEEANKRFKYDPDYFNNDPYYLEYLLAAFDEKGEKENLLRIVHSLEPPYLKRLLTPSRFGNLSPIENYINKGKYPLAILILEEAKKRLANDPLHIKFEFSIPKGILETQDEKRFPEAEDYLQKVIDQNQQIEGTSSSDISSSDESESSEMAWKIGWTSSDDNSTADESESSETEECNNKDLGEDSFSEQNKAHASPQRYPSEEASLCIVNPYIAREMRTALRIYQRRFQEAYDDLKKEGLGMCGEMVLPALKSQLQNPALPLKLISRIGKLKFLEIFNFNSRPRRYLEMDYFDDFYENYVDQIIDDMDEYKWFLKVAIERGLLTPELLKSFWKNFLDFKTSAAKNSDADYTDDFDIIHEFIVELLHFSSKYSGDEEGYFSSLEEMRHLLTPSDVVANLELARAFCARRRYVTALSILDDVNKQHDKEEDPLTSHGTWLELAKCILATKDEKRFSEVEEYLRKVQEYVPDKKENIGEIVSEDDLHKTVNGKDNKNTATYLQAALDIYRGKFEEAFIVLQTENILDEVDDVLYSALQSQLHNPLLPEKLLALIVSPISEFLRYKLKEKRRKNFVKNNLKKKYVLNLLNDHKQLFIALAKYEPLLSQRIHEMTALCSSEDSSISASKKSNTQREKDN